MTCIVGLVHQDTVWLGGDSAGVDANWNSTPRKDPKVFQLGDFLLGYTDSFRMGQLLRFRFHVPLRDPALDLFEYLATEFVDAVRDCLGKGGWKETEHGREEGGTFLVGGKGRLFTIYSDFQVEESAREYAAIGCGQAYAHGALHQLTQRPPEERVRLALETAAEFSAGVCPPFTVLSL